MMRRFGGRSLAGLGVAAGVLCPTVQSPLVAAPAAKTGPLCLAARTTTILSVRKGNRVVLMGDQQVTLGERIVAKSTAKKLRRAGDTVMCGFAGSTADAITLLEKLEGKLQEYPNQLKRACVELAKDWRSDKMMRRLEASLIVCDKCETLEIDGQGNVITPETDGIVAIGSGGTLAKAAARALIDIPGMEAEAIARKAMKIATDIDVFSNGNWDVDAMDSEHETSPPSNSTLHATSPSSSSFGGLPPPVTLPPPVQATPKAAAPATPPPTTAPSAPVMGGRSDLQPATRTEAATPTAVRAGRSTAATRASSSPTTKRRNNKH